jgi:hypothetical protein
MMFDELHDPEPLDVGLRQFAIVAERARAIRQRRARLAVRAACVGFVVLGGAAAWAAVPGVGGDTARLEPLPTIVPTTPGTIAPSTIADTAVPVTSDAGPVPLGEAAMLASLPPIELAAPVEVDAGGRKVEVYQDTSSRVCARSGDTELDCSARDARLYVTDVSAAGGEDWNVVVVDLGVRLHFVTVGAACAPGEPPGGASTARVWVCEGLDVDRAMVEDRGSGVVVITTAQQR